MRTAYETFKATSTFGAKTAAAIAKADELAKVRAREEFDTTVDLRYADYIKDIEELISQAIEREEFEITVNVCNNPTDSKAWAFAIAVMSKLQKELIDNGYSIKRIRGLYNRELNISWR